MTEASERERSSDTPAEPAAEVLAEQAAAGRNRASEGGGGDSTGVIVAVGLGGLALALGGRLVLVPAPPPLTGSPMRSGPRHRTHATVGPRGR